jgi:hypothetical protein
MLRGGGKMVSSPAPIVSSPGCDDIKGTMVWQIVSSGEAILLQSSEDVSPVGENK